jgi:hypothetical protein
MANPILVTGAAGRVGAVELLGVASHYTQNGFLREGRRFLGPSDTLLGSKNQRPTPLPNRKIPIRMPMIASFQMLVKNTTSDRMIAKRPVA